MRTSVKKIAAAAAITVSAGVLPFAGCAIRIRGGGRTGTTIAGEPASFMWNPCGNRCKISRCKWSWWRGTYRCVW